MRPKQSRHCSVPYLWMSRILLSKGTYGCIYQTHMLQIETRSLLDIDPKYFPTPSCCSCYFFERCLSYSFYQRNTQWDRYKFFATQLLNHAFIITNNLHHDAYFKLSISHTSPSGSLNIQSQSTYTQSRPMDSWIANPSLLTLNPGRRIVG